MKQHAAFALIAVVTVVAAASPALAEGPCGHGERMLQRLDLNGDGGITPGEAGAVGAVRLLRLDTDGDGVVTEDEMLAVAQERIARRMPEARKLSRSGRVK